MLQVILLLLVCQLHGNELPLRHLFIKLDGATSGPKSFDGPIGKMVQKDVHLLDVQPFKPIDSSLTNFDEKVVKDLSRDQNLLYRYTRAIADGTLESSLITQLPGPVDHARWLTLSIRLLILYTRTATPSPELVTLVTFLVQAIPQSVGYMT